MVLDDPHSDRDLQRVCGNLPHRLASSMVIRYAQIHKYSLRSWVSGNDNRSRTYYVLQFGFDHISVHLASVCDRAPQLALCSVTRPSPNLTDDPGRSLLEPLYVRHATIRYEPGRRSSKNFENVFLHYRNVNIYYRSSSGSIIDDCGSSTGTFQLTIEVVKILIRCEENQFNLEVPIAYNGQ